MRINVAIMGRPFQPVEIADGGTVLDAIVASGLDANRISEVKRNGSVISKGTALSDGQTILLVEGKIQGGNDVFLQEDSGVISVKVDTEVLEAQPEQVGFVAYPTGTTVFDMIEQNGYDQNTIAFVKKEDGTKVALDSVLEDGTAYVVVVRN